LAPYERFKDTQSGAIKAEIRAHIQNLQITRDIASGKLSDRQLAEAYALRAVARDDLADVEGSLSDSRKAAELMPDNSHYLLTQAQTLLGAGRAAEAQTVFDRALKLAGDAPLTSNEYRAIAIAQHYLGNDQRAEALLARSQSVSSAPDNLYTAFWQQVIAKRAGHASTELENQIDRTFDHAWPYPVAEMLLNRISPEKLIGVASSSDSGVEREQLCEAYFYIGQKYLYEGHADQARAAFEKSAAQAVLPFAEYGYALHELGRSKMPPSQSSSWWSH
jgi:lipoprotein NlpI